MPNLNACVALASAIESFKVPHAASAAVMWYISWKPVKKTKLQAGIVKTFAVSLGRGKKVFFRQFTFVE